MTAPSLRRAPFLASAALPVLLLGCAGAPPPAAPPPVPVRAEPVRAQDVPLELRTIGRVEAHSRVEIRAQVSGTLQTVHFTEGASVQRGARLFTIDRRPFEADLAEAEARLARDRATAENAAATVDRWTELRAKNADYVTEESLDRFRAEAESARQTVQADEAAVSRARIALGYCTISAPITGRAGDMLVHAGNVVSANGEQPLVVLLQTRPIEVTFAVPQQQLDEIRRRMAAGTLAVLVTPAQAGAEGPPHEGRLAFVDNMVSAETGTIALKATFDNDDESLWPGLLVDTTLRLGVDRGALVVPAQAVQTGQTGSFVYVVGQDGKAESRPVRMTREHAGMAVIADGLTAGETVVTDGQVRLVPGAAVEVLPAKEPVP